MTTLDYTAVSRYWSTATSSLLGPYMMEGFGFPSSAGRFRFHAERKIVDRLIHLISPDGHVLDLGCGNGCWTEYFAQQFSQVVAVEGSKPLYDALEERCAPYPNVMLVHDDVMLFEPEDQFDLVFLGGMLMYLNEEDVILLSRFFGPEQLSFVERPPSDKVPPYARVTTRRSTEALPITSNFFRHVIFPS